jgi:hypothetical protein
MQIVDDHSDLRPPSGAHDTIKASPSLNSVDDDFEFFAQILLRTEGEIVWSESQSVFWSRPNKPCNFGHVP